MAREGEGAASSPASLLEASWIQDEAGRPISLVDFDAYDACPFRLRGCADVFTFARDEAVVARLLGDGVALGLVWTEDELGKVLMMPGLTEAGLRQLVATKQVLDGEVVRVDAPEPTIRWPAPKVRYGRQRLAPPREPGDESENEGGR